MSTRFKKRVEKFLLDAAHKAGVGVPILVSSSFYSDMRWAACESPPFQFTEETRVPFLQRGVLGRWQGRWIFVSPNRSFGVPVRSHNPEPFPKGLGIVREIESHSGYSI